MPGRFSTGVTVTGPAAAAYVVTPGAAALAEPIRAITISGAGAVTYTSSIDGEDYTTASLPAGTYPLFASHILAATTATEITGWA